jgi:hypothetical protein
MGLRSFGEVERLSERTGRVPLRVRVAVGFVFCQIERTHPTCLAGPTKVVQSGVNLDAPGIRLVADVVAVIGHVAGDSTDELVRDEVSPTAPTGICCGNNGAYNFRYSKTGQFTAQKGRPLLV